MISNVTSYLTVVESQMKDLDQKTNAVCCMVHEIEMAISKTLGPICPNEAIMVNRLYKAVVEDVVELICRQPKCKDVFKGYNIKKSNDFGGIISILLKIVFSLG